MASGPQGGFAVNAFERWIQVISKILLWIGGGLLAVMIVLTCANIFLRQVWLPVSGTFELMGYLSAVATAFALALTQVGRGHIAVDVLFLRFSERTRKILNATNAAVCTGFFALVTWQISRYATTLMKTGEVTETLRIIYYPFIYAVALGCAALALVFLCECITALFPKKEEEK
jgi:TRAP-type C4-dicarboxylate transport system permease small subunit